MITRYYIYIQLQYNTNVGNVKCEQIGIGVCEWARNESMEREGVAGGTHLITATTHHSSVAGQWPPHTTPPRDKEIPISRTWKKPNTHVKVIHERERLLWRLRGTKVSNPAQLCPSKADHICTPNYVQTKISLPICVYFIIAHNSLI